jgi:hypothetical protein
MAKLLTFIQTYIIMLEVSGIQYILLYALSQG